MFKQNTAYEMRISYRSSDVCSSYLVAIVGGSKVSTKLSILQSLAAKVDHLIVGGGIANTFMLAAGLGIGRSLAEPGQVDQARKVIDLMARRGSEVPIPTDVVCAKTFSADAVATIKQIGRAHV